MRKVTIIGGGAAGMGAAYRLLETGCEVTWLEARARLGGSRGAVDVPVPGGGTRRVGVGISELDPLVFPELGEILDRLGVERSVEGSDVAFMTSEREIVWSTRRVSPPEGGDPFRWLAEKKRFEGEALEVLESDFYADFPTERYLESRGYSREFRDAYLYPRAAGCLAVPGWDPTRLSIKRLVTCWSSYGLVGVQPARRQRIAGGMERYCDAFAQWFSRRGGRLLRSHRALGVSRDRDRILVRAAGPGGVPCRVETDELVLAVHPGRAAGLLDDATAAERILAAAFETLPVRVVIHRDRRLMPRDPRKWAAFNYLVQGNGRKVNRSASLTRYFPRLGGRRGSALDIFVSFDPSLEPRSDLVLADRVLTRPSMGASARETARLARRLQGRRHTWFCGSYMREPFLHEQALASGSEVASRIAACHGAASAEHRHNGTARAAA